MIDAAAAMTTPVAVKYRDAETAVATAAREQFNAVVFFGSPSEIPMLRRIIQLERLPAGWDGYGSPAIGREVASRSIHLVHEIADLGVENTLNAFIGPVSGGGLIFEWTSGPRELSVSVLPEGKIQYLKWEADEQFEEDELGLRPSGRLRELLNWLVSQPA